MRTTAKCCICLEAGDLINLCHDKSHGSTCKLCLKDLATFQINNSFPGTCPTFTCPVCLAAWVPKRGQNPPERKKPSILSASGLLELCDTKVKEKYGELVGSILSFQCSGCHKRRSLLFDDQTISMPSALGEIHRKEPSVRGDTVLELIAELCNGNISIQECYHQLTAVHFPFMQSDTNDNRVWDTFKLVLMCVPELERRANLQLRYLRDRPFITTTCCNRKHCFRCKTKDWHHGKTCDENCACSDMKILPCPQCGIQLTRGDGCDSITCVCKTTFSWNSELICYENAMSFRDLFSTNTSDACAKVLFGMLLGNVTFASAWRKKYRIDTNKAILNIIRAKYGPNAHQWCATYTSNDSHLAIYDEAQVLWRSSHTEAVNNCIIQNDTAMRSLFTTMYRTNEERALVAHRVLRLSPLSYSSLLPHLQEPNFGKSIEIWANEHPEDMKEGNLRHHLILIHQFLILFGHEVPETSLKPVSSAVSVIKWEKSISNDRLQYQDGDTVVCRPGNISCYPAALANLSAKRSMVRFRLLSCELKGNSMSFGLATKSFRLEGSNGVGGSMMSWGVIDSRDVSAGPCYLNSNGARTIAWRKLVRGDVVTVEADVDEGSCHISLNSNEYMHCFSIPPGRQDYVFAATFANDHCVKIEEDEGSFTADMPHIRMNTEHIPMFINFIRSHRKFASDAISGADGPLTVLATELIGAAARAWEISLGGSHHAIIAYSHLSPLLDKILSPNEFPKSKSEFKMRNSDDLMTWKYVHQALCWGWISRRKGTACVPR